jgi:hypothetical protein
VGDSDAIVASKEKRHGMVVIPTNQQIGKFHLSGKTDQIAKA